ncbi:hypothetical protein FVP74_07785 [Microbacterium saccharophilum]|uniref:Uncharacterized protein n=1 Tax=Microbacterium saccharophilum TaxID=1213358 RepID=A0A5C8HXJ7_9MICO|nr:hypothetical protein [Microbacterium saccharophilum]TXK11237.1 hypothetical protein FVP74_07785 [Microbacterium saccharophilum]GEP48652.1 hypothetical protein MSA03_21600 [Microbacterium saccharophilum]
MRPSALAAALALGLGLLGMTGCSTVDGSQSVEEACLVLSDGMADIQGGLAEAQDSLSEDGDLTGAAEVMSRMEGELDELAPEITNAEVTAALSDFRAGVRAFATALGATDDVEDLVANDEFAQVAESIQSATTQFAELCS